MTELARNPTFSASYNGLNNAEIPSVPEGVDLLHVMALGAEIHILDGHPTFVWPRAPSMLRGALISTRVNIANFEWIISRGFAKLAGVRASITEKGEKFAARQNTISRQMGCGVTYMTHPVNLSVIREAARKICAAHPDRDIAFLLFIAVLDILHAFFGAKWVEAQILNSETANNFWRDEENLIHRNRIIRMAELLINLIIVKDFEEVRKRIQEGNIEDSYAELQVAAILRKAKHPFRFVIRSGERFKDYDFEATIGGLEVCIEAKCKMETTAKSGGSLANSLAHARKNQLPPDKPGLIFVRLPADWLALKGDDQQLSDDLKMVHDTVIDFLRQTERIVAVVCFYDIPILAEGMTVGGLIPLIYLPNSRHRFGDTFNFGLTSAFNRPASLFDNDWIDLHALLTSEKQSVRP